MATWIDRLQDQIDNIEDPRCFTDKQSMYCDHCDDLIIEESEWFLENYDFCSEECQFEWAENNFEE